MQPQPTPEQGNMSHRQIQHPRQVSPFNLTDPTYTSLVQYEGQTDWRINYIWVSHRRSWSQHNLRSVAPKFCCVGQVCGLDLPNKWKKYSEHFCGPAQPYMIMPCLRDHIHDKNWPVSSNWLSCIRRHVSATDYTLGHTWNVPAQPIIWQIASEVLPPPCLTDGFIGRNFFSFMRTFSNQTANCKEERKKAVCIQKASLTN